LVQKYLRDQRHLGTVAAIARLKFPFPGPEHPDLETLVNLPNHRISVGNANGKDLFPDIVVVRRPGQWLSLIAQVEMEDGVNDDSARDRWLPYSKQGDLLLYVPAGFVAEAKKLCKRHGVRVKGIRTWRFRPVWGLEVTEA
jgi:hypothetical protein